MWRRYWGEKLTLYTILKVFIYFFQTPEVILLFLMFQNRRWNHLKMKVNRYAEDWTNYNKLLKVSWEQKYSSVIAGMVFTHYDMYMVEICDGA